MCIRDRVSECAAEAHQYARQMADERIESQKATIQDAGLEIITLEPAMIQEMADTASNVYDLVREQIGDELVDELLAQVETTSAAEYTVHADGTRGETPDSPLSLQGFCTVMMGRCSCKARK